MSFLKKYDVFISYAIEDKHEVAEHVYRQLVNRGISVFYLGRELEVGDSISGSIYEGLESSRYCIVILSPDYDRYWTSAEADEFRRREFIKKTGFIFPLWHNIAYEDVKQRFPWLEDRFGISTDEGLDKVGEELSEAILKRKSRDRIRLTIKSAAILCILLLLSFLAPYLMRTVSPPLSVPSSDEVMAAAYDHINTCEQKWENDLRERKDIYETTLDSVINIFNAFARLSKNDHERNEYKLTNGGSSITGRKNLEALGFTLMKTPFKAYGMVDYMITCESQHAGMHQDSSFSYYYVISNKEPVIPSIDTIIYKGTGEAIARISYTGHIRQIYEKLTFVPQTDPIEKRKLLIMSFKPVEEYLFELHKGTWVCREVR